MVVKSHIETKEKRLPLYPVNAEIRERRLYNYLHVIGVYATNRFTISLSVSDWSDKVKYLISGNLPKVDDSYRDIYAPNGNKSLVALNTKKAANLRKRPAVSGCV